MTYQEAKQFDCPLKSTSGLLLTEASSLGTCRPEKCMCWIDTSYNKNETYNNTYLDEEEARAAKKELEAEGYNVNLDFSFSFEDDFETHLNATKFIERIQDGYCSLRGNTPITKVR